MRSTAINLQGEHYMNVSFTSTQALQHAMAPKRRPLKPISTPKNPGGSPGSLHSLSRHHFSDRLVAVQHVRFSSAPKTAEKIPVVDLSQFVNGDATAKAAFAKALGDSFKEYGFVAVTGHGIPKSLFEENYKLLGQVVGLDEATKKKYYHPEIGSQRGYYPMKSELKGSTVDGKKTTPDPKEAWQAGRSRNDYPVEVPDYQAASDKLYQSMEDVGLQLMDAIGLFLNDNGYLKSTLVDDSGKKIGSHMMRSIHYPPIPAEDRLNKDENGKVIRAGAHNDMNYITLLPAATLGGLQILKKDGQWMDVEAKDETKWQPGDFKVGDLIVNVGDMLSLITEGHPNALRSTSHKVVGNDQQLEKSRFSIPMFIHPNHDKALRNLVSGQLIEYRHDGNKIPCSDAGEYVYNRLRKHGGKTLDGQMSYAEFKQKNAPLTHGL